ncbi:hypothetical protein HG547_03555 [Shewanella sp. DNRA4]|uniref:BAR domain-like protein A BdpA n=1 Tax=Shewanella TaxID=22 RepID=UPI00146A38D4|nr:MULTISPECIES: hypothetical protein [Shewanella]MDN5498542.1 hypothetical protein [Shewanella sp.]MDN5526426.1 hypothetical protein [Shewanella sp.]NMD50708.1 hypothetical protein [Shewanella sp. DNRA4]BDA61453.1 hypothetical protein NUITMVS1_29160 [Shewanella xiamenensis]
MRTAAVISMLLFGMLTSVNASAKDNELVFASDFEGNRLSQPWSWIMGCQFEGAEPHSGESALLCAEGNSSIVSKYPVSEAGLLEFWVKTQNIQTQYRINVLTSPVLKLDAQWQHVALIDVTPGTNEYLAHRVSIDDPSRQYVRLDIEAINGPISLDDLTLDKIRLDIALQKNEQKIIGGILDKLKEDKNYEVQAESFRTLGKNYAAQLESQRQYLEYSNAIYSSITFVLATSERNKMSNPLGYNTFRSVLTDAKRIASPIQQARLGSMVKPFGDLATATLNVVSAGAYSAFAEPFKSFLAATFDRSNYDNSDLSRSDKKFAEENGLKIYQQAERFMSEIEKELQQVTALDNDLVSMQKNLDNFRKDLDKHLRSYLQHASIARTPENYSKVMSKDEQTRAQIMAEVNANISAKAEALLASNSNAELVQYMIKTTEKMDEFQEFKERFNQITSAMLTFYDRFERSIAAEQNPFTDPSDRAVWEQHAQSARNYIRQSKEAFTKAFM